MTLFGPDCLGAVHYEAAMLRGVRPLGCTGVFLRTFGEAHRTVERMCASRKFREIVVHLAPFDYSHRYPVLKNMPLLKRDTVWLQSLAVKYPNTVLLLSPFCEHNHTAERMARVFAQLMPLAPNCVPLNSVWRGGIVRGICTEIHLTDSKPVKPPPGEYSISLDGFGGDGSGDSTDSEIFKIIARYPKARQFRHWSFRLNGKFGHNDPSALADRKSWPTWQYIAGLAAQLRDPEVPPFYKQGLYKPFADDHGGGSGSKDCKAMCIMEKKFPRVGCFDSAGKTLDFFKRVTPDHELGARYYSKYYAVELGNMAEANTGSRLIRIAGSRLMDADFRSGDYV